LFGSRAFGLAPVVPATATGLGCSSLPDFLSLLRKKIMGTDRRYCQPATSNKHSGFDCPVYAAAG
jgi:hypothetical protein